MKYQEPGAISSPYRSVRDDAFNRQWMGTVPCADEPLPGANVGTNVGTITRAATDIVPHQSTAPQEWRPGGTPTEE